jgi:hypothetical protein
VGSLEISASRRASVLEQRDLAHELTAAPRRDASALPRDFHLPVDDHEELLADFALVAEHLARLDLEVLGHPCQVGEVLAGEAVEEGGALQRLHLGVLAEQLHGRLTLFARGR